MGGGGEVASYKASGDKCVMRYYLPKFPTHRIISELQVT